MKFQKYILEANTERSQKISKNNALTWIKSNAPYFQKNPEVQLYRGLDKISFRPFYKIDPTQYTRVSANTPNFYTWIIDHSDKWSSYPPRSKSIVCSTSEHTADNYGTVYAVIPKSDSLVGICPSNDIWGSFNALGNLEDFNSELVDIFNIILGLKGYNNIKTYDDFIDACQKVTKYCENRGGNLTDIFTAAIYSVLIKYNPKKHGSFYTYLESLFDPRKNGFKIGNIPYGIFPNNREVWTSGESLLIHKDFVSDIIGGMTQ